MSLSAGQRLAHYEVAGLLGTGGMGEVYRAKDHKLGRDVALKVLPDELARDALYMARFEREARVLASLNHPHIAAIYAIEESAIVMELVEGPTLAERMKERRLSLEDALPIARQVAEGLEAAHEKGVVHRDLKPANIKASRDGVVKILDFGLAAKTDATPVPVKSDATSTISQGSALRSTVVGTPAYMSPEQVRGHAPDRRSDIWAFGVLMFEMLSGARLFDGDSIADVLAAVMRSEVDWKQLPASTPPAIRGMIERCLRRDVRSRLQSIGDARVTIEEYLAGGSPTAASDPELRAEVRPPGKLPWLLSAILGCAALFLGVAYFRRAPERPVALNLAAPGPDLATFDGNSAPAISPDGKAIAFVASTDSNRPAQLWVRELGTSALRALAGTDGADSPFWSPDSKSIAFFADGKLKRADLPDGVPRVICEAPIPRGGSWNANGVILFAPRNVEGLFRVAATGGAPVAVTVANGPASQTSHRWPHFLPDGRHFLFTVLSSKQGKSAVHVGDLDSPAVQTLLPTRLNAIYAPPGYLLYLKDRSLMAQPFDADRLAITGEPHTVGEHVDYSAVYLRGHFSASQNGILTFFSGISNNAQIAWYDRAGNLLNNVGTPGVFFLPAVAPDSSRVAVDRSNPQEDTLDLWLYDLKSDASSRFTFDPGQDINPVWSPDSSRIVFASVREDTFDLFIKATTGADVEKLLYKSPDSKAPTDWSRDGRFLLFNQSSPKTRWDILVMPLTGDPPVAGKPFPFLQTAFNEGWAKLSPDGKWIAYYSDETGRTEVYVQAFRGEPESGQGGGAKWQLSLNGGDRPVWSPDGKEIFYIGPDRTVYVAPVRAGRLFEAGQPKRIPKLRVEANSELDVSPDGKRLLAIAPAPSTPGRPVTVVVNWNAALKK